MDKLKATLAISIGANIGMVLLVALFRSITKEALYEKEEHKRYLLKMLNEVLTPEQTEIMAKYAEENIKFNEIVRNR